MKRGIRITLVFAASAFSGCEKKFEIASPPVTAGILSIEHLDFGLEQFRVDDASCNLYQSEDGIWEFVVNVSSSAAIKRSKELEDITPAEPNFEATALLHEDHLDLVVGRVITQKEGYDYERDENLSNIYYFSHNSIEELRIEITEVTDEWIDAKLTGSAVINGSNGVDPDSKISLRAKFKRDQSLKRGIR
jgi:hypothetical protein